MAEWKKWEQAGDDRTRWHLNSARDTIYFCREHISHGSFDASETNHHIWNLKKKPPVPANLLKYKREAIQIFAEELAPFIEEMDIDDACMTWVPPSKAKNDPKYDDRIERVVAIVCEKTGVAPVEVFENKATREPLHDNDERRNPHAIAANLKWCDCDLSEFDTIYIVDDVLTTGANFRAVTDKIREKFKDINIIGIVWARAINKPIEVPF